MTCRCGSPIVQPATGRPRRYCSGTCRVAAHRERVTKRGVGLGVLSAPPRPSACEPARPLEGFSSFADLDAWLDERDSGAAR
jgi:hypothetical protein